MVAVPAGYDDLLERPLYGHLATTRPDGSVQVSPMWFDWDGELNHPVFDAHLLSREGSSHHAEEVRRRVQDTGSAVGQ